MTIDNIDALTDLLEQEKSQNLPLPLMRSLPPATKMPDGILGSRLNSAAEAIFDKIKAPMPICVQSLLATATLVTQGHANVLMPTGQERPLSNNFMTIAESGERKTSADNEAIKPLRMREQELREVYDAAFPSFQDELQAWEKARAVAQHQKGKSGSVQIIKSALQKVGPKPSEPIHPVLTCDDLTIEGLYHSLSTGHASQGIFSSEGGQFYGGHGMTQDNKMKSITTLSRLWDGEALRRTRRGDGMSTLPDRRVTMHLMSQPGVAALAFRDSVLIDQGFMARQLMAAPDQAAGTRMWCPAKPESIRTLTEYSQYTLDLLRQPLPMQQGKINELAPRSLTMSLSAQLEWVSFHDYVEKELASTGRYATIRSLGSKLAEHAARLSAVLTLYDDISAGEIPLDKMEAGVLLAKYYADEALRITNSSEVDAVLIQAQKLLAWMQLKYSGPLLTYQHVYKDGNLGLVDAKSTRNLFDVLVKHRYIERLEGKHEINGDVYREVYRIYGRESPE